MRRDIWIGASPYENTPASSLLYHAHAHHRYKNKNSADSRFTIKLARNTPRTESYSKNWVSRITESVRSLCYPWMTISVDVVAYMFLVAICVFCYANSLEGDFVHDDLVSVTTNPDVTGKNPLREVFFNDFWGKPMADPSSHKSYRPLTVLTFRLNHLFCGMTPWGFHLVNVLLHSAVCVLMYILCRDALRWPRWDSTIAALLFAVHPVHTEAVSSIVGRAEVLSAFFFLASLLCFMKSTKISGKNNRWFFWLLISMCCACLALLAKEQGIAVLPVCMAWRIRQLNDKIRFKELIIWKKKNLFFLMDTIFWAVLMMFVTLVAFRLWMLHGSMPKFSEEDNPASFSSSLLTRFYTYSYLSAFNAWLLLSPMTLSYDWQMGSIPLVTSIGDVRNLWTLLLFLFLAKAAQKICILLLYPASKKIDIKTLLLSVTVIVLPFLPASNIFITVGFVVAERVLYIPSVGFCILVTYGLKKLCQGAPQLRCLWKSLILFLVLLFMARTMLRNENWRSREALFKSGLASVPQNAKVHYNFANLQKDFGNLDLAIEHYRTALRLWPHHASAHNNLGTLLHNTEEAEQHFRSALTINPQHPRALFNLASLYSKQGRTKAAQELLQRALELDAEFTEAYSSLAALHAEGGQPEKAEALHLRALVVDPRNADAYNNYGTFLQKSGRVEEAVQQYKEAIRLQPNHTVAIVNAARSLRVLKNNREAEKLYKRALAINPEAKIMDNLGVLYISAGRMSEASQLYKEMREKYAEYVEGKVHFAQVLMQERSFQQAEQLLLSVTQANSTHRDAFHQLSLLYSQVNRTTEALENILKALNLCSSADVNCAQLHVDHGDILKDIKQWKDAAQSYKMAIELDPKLSHAHVNLAVINHLQGECHQALLHYHEAYILDPDNQLLQENMRKLKLHLVDGSGICQGTQPATCKSR